MKNKEVLQKDRNTERLIYRNTAILPYKNTEILQKYRDTDIQLIQKHYHTEMMHIYKGLSQQINS